MEHNDNSRRAQQIAIADYTYELPGHRIAKFPLAQRHNSQLLVYRQERITHTIFSQLPDNVPENSLMVFNNTKVIQARMIFRKPTGARIEIFCLEPDMPPDYTQVFAQRQCCRWKCIVGNLKKWKTPELEQQVVINDQTISLKAIKTDNNSGSLLVEFEWTGDVPFGQIVENIGLTPIPPYLNREATQADKQRYQTVYSKQAGSVAAPTAGLHFTPEVFRSLQQKGVLRRELTLHVGAGTFKPVDSEHIGDHEMHAEHFFVTRELLEAFQNNRRPLIAVGTTSVRMLESLYWLGVKVLEGKITQLQHALISQWEVYDLPQNIAPKKALNALLIMMHKQQITAFHATTQIIIVPGYRFRMLNGLITNFHQPHSTLLLLIAAFVGNDWRRIYDYALQHNFRFLSYGDSSLLLPKTE